jgi:GTP diphosphokinase / guanosine-3',5'-bis(diphosphate) 3'-diphosphatase
MKNVCADDLSRGFSFRRSSDVRYFKAVDLSERVHSGTFRESGGLFFLHPLAVAHIASVHGTAVENGGRRREVDSDYPIVALLHDTVEDTRITLDEIEGEFGPRVRYMVDGLTKIPGDPDGTREKVALYGLSEPGIVLVKGADREHNNLTPKEGDEEWRMKAIGDTEYYINLCSEYGFLGMSRSLKESFKVLVRGFDLKFEPSDELNSAELRGVI